jgi:murein L,D-transpeptidase YcbB/YkuD
VKFLFPNRQNIYLHDTPESHLFERTVRALSHGCIRLERPLELARLVLDRRTDLSAGALDELLARPGEKHVPLNEGIPVAIVYLTSWIGPDGDVQFLRDIYGRDAQLRAEPDGQVGND